ncbi:hypothetical protein [Phormidium sp. FACHB-1136]|uniref:hypothetical protein n=1 Tax=Phormidium sp. FACHB-1136 TaxID=2692848 RepID=UPI00168836AB|nr:hypothetical protein [Phormidium sp. FACHB-1136]MBD2425411.1 hypothetical protein [Phormidium sp. FACHB-1136]
MVESFSICDAVHCPYSGVDGCKRYIHASHCHLAYSAPGKVRKGVLPQASQYWLYATDDYDYQEVQAAQDRFLDSLEEQSRAAAIVSYSTPYPVTWRQA